MHGPIILGFSSQLYVVTRIRIRGLKEIAMRVSRGTDTPSDPKQLPRDPKQRRETGRMTFTQNFVYKNLDIFLTLSICLCCYKQRFLDVKL